MKLYTSMLEQIYKTNLTKKEIDTLLLLLQAQDDFGVVLSVHWKEITSSGFMVAQSFYNAIKGLKAKGGFIEVSDKCPSGKRNFRGFHTIRILTSPAHKEVENNTVSVAALMENRLVSLTALIEAGFMSIESSIKDTVISVNALIDSRIVPAEALIKCGLASEIPKEEAAIKRGLVSVEDLKAHISQSGSYLNLKDYSLINTPIFRKLTAEAKKIVLYLLDRHRKNVVNYGKRGITTYDINLTPEGAAKLLGFEWKQGRSGEVVRRKIKRYFNAVVASGLLPVTMNDNDTLRWAKDDWTINLPQQPIHVDIESSETDSIADTCNRRIINAALSQKKINASAHDIQQSLTIFDEQYRRVSGLKILAVGVKNIVSDCIVHCAALVPAYINTKCREFLGLICNEDISKASLTSIPPAEIAESGEYRFQSVQGHSHDYYFNGSPSLA